MIELQEVKSELREVKNKSSIKASDEEVKEGGMNIQTSGEENALMLLNFCRSIEELQSIGFNYDEEKSQLKCLVCEESSENSKQSGIFSYSSSEQSSFTPKEKLSRNFINLKAAVKKHINSRSPWSSFKDQG